MIWGRSHQQRTDAFRERIKAKESLGWHLKFAWVPTQLDDGRWVWLQSYERRYRWSSSYFESGWAVFRRMPVYGAFGERAE